jgi:hypothetical protein
MPEEDQHICGTFGALQERARELACLHQIEGLLKNPAAPLGEVLRDVVNAVPSGWCDPQACRARLRFAGQPLPAGDSGEAHPVHQAEIRLQSKLLGAIEICCARGEPCAPEDPLRKAKHQLVDSVAGRLKDFLSARYLLHLSKVHGFPDDPDVILGDVRPAEEPAASPPAEVEYPGLCITCVHSATCTFPRRKGEAVLSCEEFDDHGGSPGRREDLTPPAVEVSQASAAAAEEEPYASKGLCSSCANRKTCTFPKPPGGVWHCEEFC